MLLKLLLKIWPSFIPIISYILWIIIQNMIQNYLKKKQFIEAEFEELDKNGKKIKKNDHFSLKNPKFIAIIYLSLAFMIFSLLFFAIFEKPQKGSYVPAKNENGKIIPYNIK